MRFILKIFAVPLLLVMMFLCMLGNLATSVSGAVYTLFLFVLIICGVMSFMKAAWFSLALVVVLGFLAFVALALATWFIMALESCTERLSDFIHS